MGERYYWYKLVDARSLASTHSCSSRGSEFPEPRTDTGFAWSPNTSEGKGSENVDLETLLVALYVLADDWWRADRPPSARKPGRPLRLTDTEVLTLAVLAQWPRFRSEQGFWGFAQAHLRSYFPTLCSQSQFNRRVRALAPELRAFHLPA
jgi:hypothetical protein